MKTWLLHNKTTLIVTALILIGTSAAVSHFHVPGHLDVISAQAMDMSRMRPPTGAAVVELAAARRGAISDTVTYTGSILAYNEQDISARVTGTVLSLPVYPGDTVHAGEMVAQLDTTALGPRTAQALANAEGAQDAANVAELTHHLHHQAQYNQALAQEQAAEAGRGRRRRRLCNRPKRPFRRRKRRSKPRRRMQTTGRKRLFEKKKLADAGAVSLQDYQSELAQSQSAISALAQAQAKLREALSETAGAKAKLSQAIGEAAAAHAGKEMARAEISIAVGQTQEAFASARSAEAAVRQAQAAESYARLTAPANGVVISRPVAPGTLVQPGTTLLQIAEIDKVRVQANVAVTDLAGVHPGTLVVITPQGSSAEKPFAAAVTSVFPSANEETRTAIVEAVVPNPGHALLPGGFVTMKIARQTHSDKLLVPALAVLSEDGRNTIWEAQATRSANTIYECVICHIRYSAKQAAQFGYKDPMDGGALLPVPSTESSADGLKAHEVPVTVGASNGRWTEVISGALRPGDRIVKRGQAGLSEGVLLAPEKWGPDGPVSIPAAQGSVQ